MALYHDKISLYVEIKTFVEDLKDGTGYVELWEDNNDRLGKHYIVSIVIYGTKNSKDYKQYFEVGYTTHINQIKDLTTSANNILENSNSFSKENKLNILKDIKKVDFM